MKLLTMTALMTLLAACSTPIDLRGHPPPQDPIKGPSGFLVNKRMVLTPDGPQQQCIYTITNEDTFVLNADICYAYVIAPQRALEALKKLDDIPIMLKLDFTLGSSGKPFEYTDHELPLTLKMEQHLKMKM